MQRLDTLPVSFAQQDATVHDVVTIARKFACCLDEEAYDDAAAMLGEMSEYRCRGQTYIGRVAIIDSYRHVGDTASEKLDGVAYESDAVPVDETTALIDFWDHLTFRGRRMTFHCRQRITIDDAGIIIRIEHIDLEGEREALAAFLSSEGMD